MKTKTISVANYRRFVQRTEAGDFRLARARIMKYLKRCLTTHKSQNSILKQTKQCTLNHRPLNIANFNPITENF